MTAPDHNPYQPPKADVTPLPDEHRGDFVPGGRTVPAGNGVTWISRCWSLFASSPGIWILNILILIIISIVLGAIPIVGSLASAILSPIFYGGLALGCRSIDEGRGFRIEHLFAGFKEKAGPLAIVGLISLCLVVGIVIVMGILAAVVVGPGLLQAMSDPAAQATFFAAQGLKLVVLLLLCLAIFIPITMAIWFAPTLVVLQDLAPLEAVTHSFKGCLRNFMAFLLFGIVMLVLLIVAIIPVGLGLLVVIPMIYASTYVAYRDIFVQPAHGAA